MRYTICATGPAVGCETRITKAVSQDKQEFAALSETGMHALIDEVFSIHGKPHSQDIHTQYVQGPDERHCMIEVKGEASPFSLLTSRLSDLQVYSMGHLDADIEDFEEEPGQIVSYHARHFVMGRKSYHLETDSPFTPFNLFFVTGFKGRKHAQISPLHAAYYLDDEAQDELMHLAWGQNARLIADDMGGKRDVVGSLLASLSSHKYSDIEDELKLAHRFAQKYRLPVIESILGRQVRQAVEIAFYAMGRNSLFWIYGEEVKYRNETVFEYALDIVNVSDDEEACRLGGQTFDELSIPLNSKGGSPPWPVNSKETTSAV